MCPFFECNRLLLHLNLLLLLKPALQSLFYIIDEVYKLYWLMKCQGRLLKKLTFPYNYLNFFYFKRYRSSFLKKSKTNEIKWNINTCMLNKTKGLTYVFISFDPFQSIYFMRMTVGE